MMEQDNSAAKASAAMTAPTREEVWGLVAVLENYIADDALETPLYEAIEKAIFMIERLAQERDGCKAQDGEGNRLLAEARQRIKELEKEGNEYAEIMAEHLIESDKHDAAMLQRVELAEQQRDEYRKLADDAICLVSQDEAFSLWREMDRIRAMGVVSDGQHV